MSRRVQSCFVMSRHVTSSPVNLIRIPSLVKRATVTSRVLSSQVWSRRVGSRLIASGLVTSGLVTFGPVKSSRVTSQVNLIRTPSLAAKVRRRSRVQLCRIMSSPVLSVQVLSSQVHLIRTPSLAMRATVTSRVQFSQVGFSPVVSSWVLSSQVHLIRYRCLSVCDLFVTSCNRVGESSMFTLFCSQEGDGHESSRVRVMSSRVRSCLVGSSLVASSCLDSYTVACYAGDGHESSRVKSGLIGSSRI